MEPASHVDNEERWHWSQLSHYDGKRRDVDGRGVAGGGGEWEKGRGRGGGRKEDQKKAGEPSC